MAVSMNEVRRALDPEEPDYEAAASLGVEAVPHLRALVTGDDSMLASKAAYAASLLKDGAGLDVVQLAGGATDPVVRVAAAAAARNLPVDSAADVLAELLKDADPGIRKVARASAATR